ncbi:MAG: hypothetical protein EOP48_24370 [Sphingobacteriales bacterium]|nr:MAG: hypothetical protein EOP48_24370 [Sphingobacteriales bacterium]
MTLYQFRLLSENEQAKEVWQGEYVISREEYFSTVMLYKVHDFYVEVYYDRQTNGLITFNPFSSDARLALYFLPCLN